VLGGERLHPGVEAGDLVGIRPGREAEPDERRDGHRPHGGDVGQVDGERLPAQVLGRCGRPPEVDALDEHVVGRHDLAVPVDEGGVVTDPERGARPDGRSTGDAPDQRDLRHRVRLPSLALPRSGSRVEAEASSQPPRDGSPVAQPP
jgi:hypothetical protein